MHYERKYNFSSTCGHRSRYLDFQSLAGQQDAR
ncbi:hypothetical protein LCGC14_0935130 [marine sediment metagenome]|uniref:Uncharacterized protein n=1 Tax=marine sediment metagenome TaxID=412755 RepID=A0A0F9NRA0_9ZZZZ